MMDIVFGLVPLIFREQLQNIKQLVEGYFFLKSIQKAMKLSVFLMLERMSRLLI
jgi:hypothetical protein